MARRNGIKIVQVIGYKDSFTEIRAARRNTVLLELEKSQKIFCSNSAMPSKDSEHPLNRRVGRPYLGRALLAGGGGRVCLVTL